MFGKISFIYLRRKQLPQKQLTCCTVGHPNRLELLQYYKTQVQDSKCLLQEGGPFRREVRPIYLALPNLSTLLWACGLEDTTGIVESPTRANQSAKTLWPFQIVMPCCRQSVVDAEVWSRLKRGYNVASRTLPQPCRFEHQLSIEVE